MTLSGGQQQMLAVAQGLVRRPRLLMLDEPSAGLSPVLVDRVLAAVARLREGGTAVLLVEQLIEKALAARRPRLCAGARLDRAGSLDRRRRFAEPAGTGVFRSGRPRTPGVVSDRRRQAMSKHYDRSAEDLGNIVGLEHVNLQIEDQGLATLFYISGLGLTRDPYMMTSIDNMWVNVGRSQFHLITGTPQHLRGRVGLVVPDREALLRRLENMRKPLKGTKFDFTEHDDHVEAICPWGNHFFCHDPAPRFGRINLGMPYVEFDVPVGAAKGVADFYAPRLWCRDEGRWRRGADFGRHGAGAGLPRDQGEARAL